jgi:aspartate dehydrogenase
MNMHTMNLANASRRDVVLIGYGALARHVIAATTDDPTLRISSVLVRTCRNEEVAKSLPSGIRAISSIDDCDQKPDLLVELASHSAVAMYVPAALELGIDVAIASTGALADKELLATLANSAERGGARLHIIAGAVGGIDALAALREGDLYDVLYTGRKPPGAWKDTPAAQNRDLDVVKSATTVYEGNAREAARLYPRNANVAATIALAGLGFDRTRVCLVADPSILENIHRIEAISSAGTFVIELTGKPMLGNPRTSLLTAFSALRVLRNCFRPIVI